MTLSSLFIVCSHGRRSAHEVVEPHECEFPAYDLVTWCPGGRPVTLGDLGGEKVWWCEEHRTDAVEPSTDAVGKWLGRSKDDIGPCWYWKFLRGPKNEQPCRMVKRILIPLPDSESVGVESQRKKERQSAD